MPESMINGYAHDSPHFTELTSTRSIALFVQGSTAPGYRH
jgi:hypothetical protein